MHILWLNWRDIRNPEAGGAEVLTHEVARRLVKQGYEVTLFSASFPGCIPEESIDGIKYVRSGSKYSVYKKGRNFYETNHSLFNIIIDEINTRPFLTPKFVNNKPIIALIHQLAREFWFYETPFPLNYIGYHYLEKKWLSNYKDIHTVTVSQSTKRDLEQLGFSRIHVIPEGLKTSPMPEVMQKELQPTIIFTGRLKKAKLPHHAVKAFSLIKRAIPEAKMWVVGDGYMMNQLKEIDVPDVTFFGRISNDIKEKLTSAAHLALVPGLREGWGLVVTESNAMGTPVIAYDVPGLRDSVINGKTGILTRSNTPEALAEEAIRLLNDKNLLDRLSRDALEDSKKYSWDKTADEFGRIIRSVVG